MNEKQPGVLIVDDEASIRRSLTAYLADDGFQVLAVGSAEEALSVLSTTAVTVVIVDIRLPKMDGETFIHRAHHLYPDLRFVIHTGVVDYVPPENLTGIDELTVMTKPVDNLEMLVDTVRRRT